MLLFGWSQRHGASSKHSRGRAGINAYLVRFLFRPDFAYGPAACGFSIRVCQLLQQRRVGADPLGGQTVSISFPLIHQFHSSS